MENESGLRKCGGKSQFWAGVDSVETFKKLLRSGIVHKSRENAKAIEARCEEAWRKNQSAKQVKPPRKNDIIQGR